ncbi:UDP-N-acetylglucosamine 4,6-dehydratase (inverting) [Candidatus Pelagibacter sp.]|nr:UDP-N-acetylglucosamine 4,6-dehydratase (inverting) [Candidatus Pelagibacter sp.]
MKINNASILITGGTGTFGKAMVSKLLKSYPNIKRLVIFSRDELKQDQMNDEFSTEKYKNLRYFIGDVRDYQRLLRALDGIDIIIHAAALKQVPAAEYNPIEFIKTNVIGAQNIIEAAIEKKVKKVIALSTDKACSPINLYGASKLCSDKLFVAANSYAGRNGIFSVVRYGNVMGSRGSIIPKFLEQAKKGILNVTDPNMTRFNITLKDSVKMVLFALKNMKGAEILVPKIPSYKIIDLAKSIGPNCKIKVIGIRSGEKIHEEMISESDSFTTFDIGDYYIILPAQNKSLISRYKKFNIKKVLPNFRYASGTNSKFLNIKELRFLIKNYVKN